MRSADESNATSSLLYGGIADALGMQSTETRRRASLMKLKTNLSSSKLAFFPCKHIARETYLHTTSSKGMRRAVVSGFGVGLEICPERISGESDLGPRSWIAINPLGLAHSVPGQRLQCLADSTYEENSKLTRIRPSRAEE